MTVDQQHDVLVDLADQHHLRDLHGLLVRHPQAVDELDREAQPLHVAGDLGAAAVDDHGVHADVLEQGDVARELLLELRVAIAAPPYLITTVLPATRGCTGSASRSVATFGAPAARYGPPS